MIKSLEIFRLEWTALLTWNYQVKRRCAIFWIFISSLYNYPLMWEYLKTMRYSLLDNETITWVFLIVDTVIMFTFEDRTKMRFLLILMIIRGILPEPFVCIFYLTNYPSKYTRWIFSMDLYLTLGPLEHVWTFSTYTKMGSLKLRVVPIPKYGQTLSVE